MRLFKTVAYVVLSFSAALHCAALSAQVVVPGGGTITELKRGDLEGAPGMEVVTSRGEYKPGDRIPAHFHDGMETGVVIQGAMIQRPGQAPEMLVAGTPIWNLRGVVHAGYQIIGDTPLILLTVHIVDKGRPVYEYVK
jgi:quercetin dioxygenase-like cupin family protein